VPRAAQQFAAQRGRPRGDLPALIHELGLEQGVLNQPWTELSVRARDERSVTAMARTGRFTSWQSLVMQLRPSALLAGGLRAYSCSASHSALWAGGLGAWSVQIRPSALLAGGLSLGPPCSPAL